MDEEVYADVSKVLYVDAMKVAMRKAVRAGWLLYQDIVEDQEAQILVLRAEVAQLKAELGGRDG
jgi:hypothetical protein